MATDAEVSLPNGWEPRRYQLSLWSYFENGGFQGGRADVVAHRRWGKDDVALNLAAMGATERPGAIWHMLPEASQARKAIWDAINPHTGVKRIDQAFPKAMRTKTRETDMLIEFGDYASSYQVVGSDNYNSLVGAPPVGVIFSEWSLARPDAWTYIRPILAENGGWAIFIWTPRGRNHATVAFDSRRKDPAWFTLKQSALETSVFTPEQLEREKAELIAETGSKEEGEARFASEYLVDFDAATPGSYYANLIREAEIAGRVTRVPYDPALKVDTAWDLGIDDYTAIWFFQQVGREVRAIDYFETSGVGLEAVVRQAIAGKPYLYGTHHLPHDVMVRELTTGRSRYETLLTMGLSGVSAGVAQDPEDRISAARLMIPLTWFDAEACALGLNRLRAYRKRWNRQTHTYTGPLHDQASHGADAFGEFASNRRNAPSANLRPKTTEPHQGPLSWMG